MGIKRDRKTKNNENLGVLTQEDSLLPAVPKGRVLKIWPNHTREKMNRGIRGWKLLLSSLSRRRPDG
jgi:hypothetical protein